MVLVFSQKEVDQWTDKLKSNRRFLFLVKCFQNDKVRLKFSENVSKKLFKML